jgi:hypothetical protein
MALRLYSIEFGMAHVRPGYHSSPQPVPAQGCRLVRCGKSAGTASIKSRSRHAGRGPMRSIENRLTPTMPQTWDPAMLFRQLVKTSVH